MQSYLGAYSSVRTMAVQNTNRVAIFSLHRRLGLPTSWVGLQLTVNMKLYSTDSKHYCVVSRQLACIFSNAGVCYDPITSQLALQFPKQKAF